GAGIIVGLALLILGIALAPRRSEALRRASLDIALAGLLLLLLLPLGRALVTTLPQTLLAQQAAAGLYDAFAPALGRLAIGLTGVGVVLLSAAQSLVGRSWLPSSARAAWAWLAQSPDAGAHRFLRGALFLAAGVGTLLRPFIALQALALVAGVCLAFVGLQE